MSIIVICALLLAFVIYIAVGLSVGRRTKGIADMLPLGFDSQARVENSAEFSASTVATTISLATVIMAFFNLAQSVGLWLFWTVITTTLGLLVVRLFAKTIWQRLSVYDHRPTLYEFLGNEYDSRVLAYVGAVCTSLIFLSAFAVELIVGSKLFAQLVPAVPPWVVVIVLSVVAFSYTAVGGFRAVIVTDRIQMISIWLLLLALPVFYVFYIAGHGGWAENFAKIPAGTFRLEFKNAPVAFILGIFVMNTMTYVSDMSIWQRIAAAKQTRTVTRGLWSSVLGSAAAWSLFVVLACLVFMIVTPAQGVNPLLSLLEVIRDTAGVLPGAVLFVVCLGLYGAMLSTASTQLIAVSHTLYEDVFAHIRKHPLAERLTLKGELAISRTILVIAAIFSTVLVQLLSLAGFSIVDMVFAIYGAQVGLCPLVIAALLLPKDKLKGMSAWAAVAVSAGFIAGWEAALLGRFTQNQNLVFLAPVFSLIVSSAFLCVGLLVRSSEAKDQS